MEFILVREPVRGRIIYQEILNPNDTRSADDPDFTARAVDRRHEIEALYPDAEVIYGIASSIEAFLDSYPEYREIVPAKD